MQQPVEPGVAQARLAGKEATETLIHDVQSPNPVHIGIQPPAHANTPISLITLCEVTIATKKGITQTVENTARLRRYLFWILHDPPEFGLLLFNRRLWPTILEELLFPRRNVRAMHFSALHTFALVSKAHRLKSMNYVVRKTNTSFNLPPQLITSSPFTPNFHDFDLTLKDTLQNRPT